MQFQWDAVKNDNNIQKHGLDFNDALQFFMPDVFCYEHEDNRFQYDEIRLKRFVEFKQKLFCIIFTRRDQVIRLISFRRANKRERHDYEQRL
jgi:uncharacterized protein